MYYETIIVILKFYFILFIPHCLTLNSVYSKLKKKKKKKKKKKDNIFIYNENMYKLL